jgi:Ca2+/H+ antiporter
MADDSDKPELKLPRSRLVIGIAIFVIGHAAPLAIPLVTSSSLSTGWKTALSGLMIFGIPELMTLLAVVVLGKAGFNAVKALVFGWLGRTLLPAKVSKPRYYIGLVLFLIPFFVGWVSPYLFEVMPGLAKDQLIVAISGDVALIAGLCLMGGEAWDKLRSLFIHNAEVKIPSTANSAPG